MSRKVMQMALEALESDPVSHAGLVNRKQAINALRQALQNKREPLCWTVSTGWVYDDDTSQDHVDEAAKQEHKPIAYINVEKQKLEFAKRTLWDTPTTIKLPKIPLYTALPKKEWQGLTDKEITSVCYSRDWTAPWTDTTFARAIEEKLKEKNA